MPHLTLWEVGGEARGSLPRDMGHGKSSGEQLSPPPPAASTLLGTLPGNRGGWGRNGNETEGGSGGGGAEQGERGGASTVKQCGREKHARYWGICGA